MRLDDLSSAHGLLPGVYRGIPLSIVDISSDHGRRVLEYLFPGVDPAAYDDFGVAPAGISLEALYVGDDYRARAAALAAAFEAAGPGLLIHPWLGPMSVIMEEPAQIRFSERELRVVRISARFKRAPAFSLSGLVGSVLSSAVSAVASTASAVALAIAGGVLSSVRASASIRSRRRAVAVAARIATPPAARSAVAGIRAALASSSPAGPVSYDAWIIAASTIVSTVSVEPAVAPASATPAQAPSSQALMSAGLAISAGLIEEAQAAPSSVDTMLLSIGASHFVAQVAAQSSYADFASRQEALAYRGRIVSALASLCELVEDSAPDSMQAVSSAFIRAARTLSAAVVSDLNEIIGRLPAVRTMTASRATDAWLAARHLSGDGPERLEGIYADIVQRNDPRHPAALDAGTIEFLEIP